MNDEFVNVTAGGHAILADEKKRHWWNWYVFPLVPQFEYRPANERNASSFYFAWLGFRTWNTDNLINFQIQFHIDNSGIGFAGSLPYLRWWFWILPFPERLTEKLMWLGHRWGKEGKPW